MAILLALALLALLWAILERRRIVATSAALVDANRELADARLNLANEAERERRRISRDLHDQTLADLRHLALLTDQIKVNGESTGNQNPTTALRSEIEVDLAGGAAYLRGSQPVRSAERRLRGGA